MEKKIEKKIEEAIREIARRINEKRRDEFLTYLNKKTFVSEHIKEARTKGIYEKGSKSKVWRKLAVLPKVVDDFFTQMYGLDYFKDKDFFTKKFTEWRVINDV